jgi:putative Mg2+ transporter-C (MgtC) family protein
MLSFEQMLVRFLVAIVLGAVLGVEREIVGKEAGVRTEMLVAGGASVFAMIGLILPYITSQGIGALPDMFAVNSAFGLIANVVVGIGFLGAGLIIHNGEHARGLTTAALVWTTAAIGILAGLGLFLFALTVAIIIALLLSVLWALNISERVVLGRPKSRR